MSWDITGHEWAVALLQQHVMQAEERHAYLFTGPQGVGRRTLALRFVQALNCPKPLAPGQPCRTCRTCRQIERQQHPDMSVVQAEQEGKEIKVEQIRTLQHSLSLSPYEARYRVALLLNFQGANANAQNAMLKTLEEAPTKVILLVTADIPENLLPTIASRCEVLRLRPLPLDQLSQFLQQNSRLDEAQARLLSHLSGGRVGYALRLQAEPALLEKRQKLLDALQDLLPASRRARFAYAEHLLKDRDRARDALRPALQVWLSYWRDVLLCTARTQTPLVNLDRESELRRVAACLDLAAAHRVVNAIEKAQDRLDANVNPRLLAETLLLDWPRVKPS